MMTRRRFFGIVLLVVAAGLVWWYTRYQVPQLYSLSGQTMGTSYQVKVVLLPGEADTLTAVHTDIERLLENMRWSLSTWEEKSLISRFNAASDSMEPFPIDNDFAEVTILARQIHRASGGAFNPSLAPLIRLWGFDRGSDPNHWPTGQEIARSLRVSNFSMIEFVPSIPPMLWRIEAGVELNFSAIAKGYGIDRVAAVLNRHGIEHYLIDIGGELLGKGLNPDGEPWRVGIETPDAGDQRVETIIALQNQAVATSGDYRNYREKDGQRLSHLIDPRDGRPIGHRLASASVRADSAALADGWATALMVLGEEGLDLCVRQNLACLLIIREDNGAGFTTRASPDW